MYYSQKGLKHFGLEILEIHGILEHIAFKYIFWYRFIKIRKEKNWTIHKDLLNYIKCHKDFNTVKLYTLKALLSKNYFCFFFLILWHTPVSPFIVMPRCWHPNRWWDYLYIFHVSAGFTFSKFNMLSQKAFLTRGKIKINILDKKTF